jgi:hypothetical protein
MAGWIKISRDIMETQGYIGEKFIRPMCWIDLLLLAELKPKEVFIRGIKVTVERGQIAISTRDLATRWSLSVPTVLKRLKEMVNDKRISVTSSNVVNIITILDYEKHQVSDEDISSIQQDLFGNEYTYTPAPTNKKSANGEKQPRPQKHHYAPEVLLTEQEYAKLGTTYGEVGARWMIQKLDDYKAARGTTYKSDYRAILNWVVKEYQKQKHYGETSKIGQSATAMAKARRDADFKDYIAGKLGGKVVQGDVQDG